MSDWPSANDDDDDLYDEEDLGTCPYLDRWESVPGHDPDAVCAFGCWDEPQCVTCVPKGGWPSRAGVRERTTT